MTHEYTIMVGGVVHPTRDPCAPGNRFALLPGAAQPTAIAWAEGTVLAVGSDTEVRAISRGDSRFLDLRGAHVVPLAARLEPGGPADFEIIAPDLAAGTSRVVAVVKGGRVVHGAFTE